MRSTLGALFNRAPIPIGGSTVSALSALSASSPVTESLEAMGSVGTLFAIVNRNSNGTSQAQWHLYRKENATGLEKDRIEVTSHPALDLWNQPNPTTWRQEFVEGSQQHLDLTGEAWWVIGRHPKSSLPLEMWYVRPDRMTVAVGPAGVTGYVYRGPGGVKVPLDVDQVISLLMPNPMDRFRGLGPVQSILTHLDSVRYTADWNRRFFQNSAEPGGMVEVPVTLSDAEFQQMRTRWREQHKGASNAHRVAIMEGGAKWVPNAMTHRDMQFAELQDVSRDMIREAFTFPESMLGSGDPNRSNADAGLRMFAMWIVQPRLERIKGALNTQLLPLYGDDSVEFDYDDPTPENADDVRQDLQTKSLAAQRYVKAGWDPDDVLEALQLPAMRHGGLPANEPPPPSP